VNLVEDRREIGGFVEKGFEGFDCLFFREIEQELVLNLQAGSLSSSISRRFNMTDQEYRRTFITALSGSSLISGIFASTIKATKLIKRFAFFLRVVNAV